MTNGREATITNKEELAAEANRLLASYFGADCEYPILSYKQWRNRYTKEFRSYNMDGMQEMIYRKNQGKNIRNLKPKAWLNMGISENKDDSPK